MQELNDIYIVKIKNQLIVKKLLNTSFENILNKEEIDRVIELYSQNKLLYNDKAVRLDNIIQRDTTTLELSLINFFDFISTNMVNMKKEYLKKIITTDTDRNLIKKVEKSIQSEYINNFLDVLTNKHLANILAVSILVKDKDGYYGLVQRTSNVAIGSNFMGVTCTGSLDETDFFNDNPIISCIKRELKEELNIVPDEIKIDSIVISKTKLQPIVIANCTINDTFVNFYSNARQASDYDLEVKNLYVVPLNELEQFIMHEKLTDAAKYQITKEFKKTKQIYKNINKQDYKL